MSNELSVWWNGKVTGELWQDADGGMSFAYEPEWLDDPLAPALSISLPKRAEPFRGRECQPFFGGMLPEEGQRRAIARALGISVGNDFRLLEHLGGEIAGALTLLPDGEVPPQPSVGGPDVLGEERLLQLLQRLPIKPMLAGENGLRLSLAGAQSKLPVLLVDDQIALPRPGQPTSHILKPPIASFEGTTENEFYCMSLAKVIGLDVASVSMRSVEDKSFLLIERYDRARDIDGQLVRLHQEDFAQALAVPSYRKYASEGGPTFRDSFALLREATSRPARNLLKLADAAIFNLIIGNSDAHAKNFSLLHVDREIRLAPLYDLLSTVIYPELSPKLAMEISKKATLEEIEARHWTRFAEENGLAAPYLHGRVKQLCEIVVSQVEGSDSALSKMLPEQHGFTRIGSLILDRASRIYLKAE